MSSEKLVRALILNENGSHGKVLRVLFERSLLLLCRKWTLAGKSGRLEARRPSYRVIAVVQVRDDGGLDNAVGIIGKKLDSGFEGRANRTCCFSTLNLHTPFIPFSFFEHCSEFKVYVFEIFCSCDSSRNSLMLLNHVMELCLFFR